MGKRNSYQKALAADLIELLGVGPVNDRARLEQARYFEIAYSSAKFAPRAVVANLLLMRDPDWQNPYNRKVNANETS